MQVIKQGEVTASLAAIPFTSVDETDLQARLSGALSITARVIKADQTSVAGSGNLDEPDSTNAPGCRRYVASAADTSVLGPSIIRLSATGMETRELAVLVLPYAPYDSPGARTPSWLAIQNGEGVAARRSVPFTTVSSNDLQARLDASGLTFTVRILKADGTSVAGAGAVVQPDAANALGCCFYVGTASDFDVDGETVIRISATGMETRELAVTVVPYDPYAVETITTLTNASTTDLIRDRIAQILKGLTPSMQATNRFREIRGEGADDLMTWAEENPTAAFRVFQVQFDGMVGVPEVSNSDFEERLARFVVTIAYPNDGRAGKRQSISLEKMIGQDLDQLEKVIGLYSRANFSAPYPDACFRDWSSSRSTLDVCTYLTVEVTYSFIRSLL